MKGSKIAFIVSIAFHGIMMFLFIFIRVEQEYKKASGAVAVTITEQIKEKKLILKRKNFEPIKREMVPKNDIERPMRTIELTTSAKIIRTQADRGTPSLKASNLPTDLKAPIGRTQIGDLSGSFKARELQRPLREKRSQLVEFIDKTKGKREIIYCLDVSASMSAPGSNKLNLARGYIVESLLSLTEQDSFNIIVFSKDIKLYYPSGTIIATKENIGKAIEFLNQWTAQNTKSNTKTDLLSPILYALNMKPNIVVTVTDGLPTVGVIQPEKILQNISDTNMNIKARIFAIGMEMDEDMPEAWLLKEIANQNNGEFQLL